VQQERNVKGSDPVEIPKTVLGFPEHLFEFGKTISGSDRIAPNRLCSLERERSNAKTAERSDVFLLAE